ncbi:MAG: MFS transporter, partial [Bacteroidetes bacterium]
MTVLNDVLIPHLKAVFVLSYAQSMLVQMAFFGAYFTGAIIYYVISITSGDPINKIGYKKGIVIGLIISAIGSALFYPATYLHVYSFYLLALYVLGLGFTMLQIAANPFVAIVGSPETASSRLNFTQGFNS